jgi:myosin heavy subunit
MKKKEKIYCGVRNPPKGKRIGTEIECAEKKQIRRYGEYKAGEEALDIQTGQERKQAKINEKEMKKETIEENKINKLIEKRENLLEKNNILINKYMDLVMNVRQYNKNNKLDKEELRDIKEIKKNLNKMETKIRNINYDMEKIKNKTLTKKDFKEKEEKERLKRKN